MTYLSALSGIALSLVALAVSVAHADPRSIGTGAELTPFDIGHIFAESCFEDDPGRIEGNAKAMGRVLSLTVQEDGRDGAAKLTDLSNDLYLIVEDGRDAASCAMEIDGEAAGDGADLYESVEAHLVEWIGELPEADYVDGGLIWAWEAEGMGYTLTFIEWTDAFALTLDLERE